MQTNSAAYFPAGFVDSVDGSGHVKEGSWRKEGQFSNFTDLPTVRGSRYTQNAVELREALTDYVNGAGSVNWTSSIIDNTYVVVYN